MIKKFAIKYKLKKQLKSGLFAGDYNGEVLFLLDEDSFSKEEISVAFIEVFGKAYQLNFINFTVNQKKKKEFPQNYFTKTDFNLFGQLKNDGTKKLMKKKYEYIFHFYEQENNYLNLLSAQAKANLRVGINQVNQDLIHIQLNLKEKNLPLYFKEAFKYLEIIKKSA